MDFDLIDERFRGCSTLLQALLAVNTLEIPAGRIDLRDGTTRGLVDFQSSRITRVVLTRTYESGAQALDILVSIKDARCLYLAPNEEPEPDRDEEVRRILGAVRSAKGADLKKTLELFPIPPQPIVDPADGMGETMQPDSRVMASPLKTGERKALMREQLWRAVQDDDLGDMLQRHKEEFLKVSGKLTADEPQDDRTTTTGGHKRQMELGYESGVATISRAGFVLVEEGAGPLSVDKELAACSSLLDALLTLSALGIKAGVLELSSQSANGTVQFRNGKVTQSVIAGTDQTGEAALRLLISITGASCKYGPIPDSPDKSLSGSFKALGGSSRSSDGTFKSVGSGESGPIGKAVNKPVKSAPLLPHQRKLDDDEAVAAVPDEEVLELHRAQFEQTGERLSDAPVRHDIHYMPTSKADNDDVDRDAIRLARAGFVWDFHDLSRSSGLIFNGDPSTIPIASVKISRTSRNMRKYVLPLVVLVLCLAIFTVPAMLWRVSAGNNPERRQQMQNLADSTFDGMDDGNAIRRKTFELPNGSSGPLPPSPVTAAGGEATEVDKLDVSRKDPSDRAEFSLADSASTLPQLEELIFRYIAKKNYRRARDLALAGIRSLYATPEDRQRFFDIYKQCLHK